MLLTFLPFQHLFTAVCGGGEGVSLPRGLCWFIPGVAGGIPHDT
jgi:hypothetical protein